MVLPWTWDHEGGEKGLFQWQAKRLRVQASFSVEFLRTYLVEPAMMSTEVTLHDYVS